MKHSILHSAITAAMAIGLVACSSSGSDVAGIGGSGVTSSGTITGFGSVFVNGVEYETNSATFSVDDNPGIESDLAIGMRVTVQGTVNDDGVSGTATSVTFDDQVQGPVVAFGPVDADGTGRRISVLGTLVDLNSNTTIFDVSGTGGAIDFDTDLSGSNVEVSGFADSTGVIRATRIELKEQTFVFDSSVVELKGVITGLTGTTFSLQGIAGVSIDASSAAIDDLPGLADGASVEVKGTCPDPGANPLCNTVNATRVEGQSPEFGDDDDVEIEGIVTGVTDQNIFEVDGVPVNATNATRIPATFTVALDKEVEVEGTIVNGTLIATKVKDEGGEIKIAATVDFVDSSTGTIELLPVTDQPTITVKIDTSTQIEDDIGGINSAALLNSLVPGTDYLVVEGYDDGTSTNTIIATEIEREAPDDVIIQGIITAGTATSGDVTVLGVTIPYDISGGGNDTEFEDENDVPYATAADFFDDVTLGTTLVKVKDKTTGGGSNPVGTADEIEIELP